MQFPGYWVANKDTYITIDHTIFDETELTPESNWKEAWQNVDSEAGIWGYVDIKSAIKQAAKLVAEINKTYLTEIEIETLLSDRTDNPSASELSRNLIALSIGYKLSTLNDIKMLNAALNL